MTVFSYTRGGRGLNRLEQPAIGYNLDTQRVQRRASWASDNVAKRLAIHRRFGIGCCGLEMSAHFSCNGHFIRIGGKVIVSNYRYFFASIK